MQRILFHPAAIAIILFVLIVGIPQTFIHLGVREAKAENRGGKSVLDRMVAITQESGQGELEYGDIRFLITRVQD